jgi:hypothetical protein
MNETGKSKYRKKFAVFIAVGVSTLEKLKPTNTLASPIVDVATSG